MSAAGVIFDFDGVIVDSERIQYESYAEVLRGLGVRIDPGEYEREWIAAGRGPEYAVSRYHLEVSPDDLRRRKEPVYQAMLRQQGQLMPAVEEMLPALAAVFPLALATNSNQTDTAIILDGFDLRRHFSAVVTREAYQRRKPAPDAFVTAAAALDLECRRCVVVEDATKGVLAAVAAGCPCVAIPHSFTSNNDFSGAAVVLDGLRQLTPDLVRRLAGVAEREDAK